ncbi:hypothetical protein H0H92_004846 [Tricholoma furcatifolium]|nr:hypothetical protein H0H92_004846 [Tricholoma furcatifolium]
MDIGVTTFHRRNAETGNFEPVGEIEWLSNVNATIHFGQEEVSIKDLRKIKNANSQSRRFKVAGDVYKWKLANSNGGLYCIDYRDRTIATWSQQQLQLRVSARGEAILDRLFVTLMLNLWIRHVAEW